MEEMQASLQSIVFKTAGVAFLSLGFSATFFSQQKGLAAESTDLRVISVHSNPRDPSDQLVRVRVTIGAGDETLVIPDCAAPEVTGHCFTLRD